MAVSCEGLGKFRPIRECANGHIARFYSIHGKWCADCGNRRYRERWGAGFGSKRNKRRSHERLMGLAGRERVAEKNRIYREGNKGRYLKHQYGLTLADYAAMLEKQRGLCAICGKQNKKLVVDHNHSTGKVRALLCRSCNTGIGCLKESPDIFNRALKYLEAYA